MNIYDTRQGIVKSILSGIYGLVGLGVTDVVMDLSDAPGGDLSLDDIFGENVKTPTTVESQTIEPQVAATTTTPPTEPVIKTKTGTVYKSIGDAVEGIEHKDQLIAQLREQVRQKTGADPLTVKPTAPAPVDYTVNQDKYFEDIAKAVENKDTAGYMRAQQKLIWDSLGPLAPTIASLSRANAERVVSETYPEFKGFLASEQYSKISEESPLLADAIRSAENNPAAASQLPELYRIAYLANQGRRVPELIQSVRHETPPVQPRPTVQSTPLPAPTQATPSTTPTLETREGRKELIAQMERGGIGNQRW